jgi:hypothetical protein
VARAQYFFRERWLYEREEWPLVLKRFKRKINLLMAPLSSSILRVSKGRREGEGEGE